MFTAAVNTYGTQNIAAVGSRSLERASAFAKEHSIDHVFGSYDELFASDTIEAVYISNHIDGHLDLANAALEAGSMFWWKNLFTIRPVKPRRRWRGPAPRVC